MLYETSFFPPWKCSKPCTFFKLIHQQKQESAFGSIKMFLQPRQLPQKNVKVTNIYCGDPQMIPIKLLCHMDLIFSKCLHMYSCTHVCRMCFAAVCQLSLDSSTQQHSRSVSFDSFTFYYRMLENKLPEKVGSQEIMTLNMLMFRKQNQCLLFPETFPVKTSFK